MQEEEIIYQIALTMVPQIGAVHARALLEHFGSAKNLFKANRSSIEKTDGIGIHRAKKIKSFSNFHRAEAELDFIARYKIQPLYIGHPAYPGRLLNCYDPPTVIYYKGNADLNAARIISIVGTRMNTAYGMQMTEQIIRDLSSANITIVSGLAFGIDAIAHRTSLRYQLPTIGVVGHGLDTVYPPQHNSLAKEMIQQGGLLSEFMSTTKPDKHNFPTRNRIVAGMSDATVVIETSTKGGSMITAELANGYSRDVFAVPGKTSDAMSAGTNFLIRSNKAVLLTKASEILELLGWDDEKKEIKVKAQRSLFIDLNTEEKLIITLLEAKGKLAIDEINIMSGLSSSVIAASILNLEMNGIIGSLPGKIFQII
ncbi:MAG: DNA-processing protein DprA [Chitinophagaceae bacterium]